MTDTDTDTLPAFDNQPPSWGCVLALIAISLVLIALAGCGPAGGEIRVSRTPYPYVSPCPPSVHADVPAIVDTPPPPVVAPASVLTSEQEKLTPIPNRVAGEWK